MIPSSWLNISDPSVMSQPITYVKWLVDIAVEAGYITTGGAVASVNGETGVVLLDTDKVPEGLINLYFTNTRATNALIGTNISIFNNNVGYITLADIPSMGGDFDGGSPTDVHLITQKFDGGSP